MTAGTLLLVVMIISTMRIINTNDCPKLDMAIWNYKFCPHPDSDAWNNLKIKMNCDNHQGLYYHCASNTQGCYVQQCVKRVYCEAGFRPLLDPSKDTAIRAPCTFDKYQTSGFWSDEQSDCGHEKTICDGTGQIECQPGSTTTDKSCRCDVHKNLALESHGLHNATCCTRNDPWCYCVDISPCPNGTVLHDNYKCLEECPPNSFRHWDSVKCYSNRTTNVDTSPMTTTSFTAVTTAESPGVNTGIIVGVVLGSIAGFIIIAVLVGFFCWFQLRKNRRNNGGPGESHTNGHVSNGRTKNDVALLKVIHEQREASTLLEEEATEEEQLLQSPSAEAGPSTERKGDLRGIEISDQEGRDGDESVEALLHPLGKKMTGGKVEQVIVKKMFKNCTFINRGTKTNVHGGKGNTINVGKKHTAQTTIHENPTTGNKDTSNLESMESSNGRSSSVGENPENQNFRPGQNLPQQETQGGSLMTDTESEHRAVEYEERVEQHMSELKPCTGNDQTMKPQEVSVIGSISEETSVKWTQSNPCETTEEVKPKEVWTPTQDDLNCSHDETKKKELFNLEQTQEAKEYEISSCGLGDMQQA